MGPINKYTPLNADTIIGGPTCGFSEGWVNFYRGKGYMGHVGAATPKHKVVDALKEVGTAMKAVERERDELKTVQSALPPRYDSAVVERNYQQYVDIIAKQERELDTAKQAAQSQSGTINTQANNLIEAQSEIARLKTDNAYLGNTIKSYVSETGRLKAELETAKIGCADEVRELRQQLQESQATEDVTILITDPWAMSGEVATLRRQVAQLEDDNKRLAERVKAAEQLAANVVNENKQLAGRVARANARLEKIRLEAWADA